METARGDRVVWAGFVSIAKKAVRGAVWNIGLGVTARAIGAVGTIIVMHFLSPEQVGEVFAAWIVIGAASLISRMGLDQYLIVKQADGDDVAFHALFYSFVLGLATLVPAAIFGDVLDEVLAAPNMGQYLVPAAIAMFIRRMTSVVDRVLVRDLRFKPSAIASAVGELAFQAAQLSMLALGLGGFAIVYGNIVQAVVMLTIVTIAAGRGWLKIHPLSWDRTKDMVRFGLPLNFETLLHWGSRQLDNLLFSARFGVGAMGLYNSAYKLADIPATHIGEHISGVLLPSMTRYEAKHRPDVLIRSTALLAILIFPMAVGLGVVADPLIGVIAPEAWSGVAELLAPLAVLSVFRPVSWVASSYLRVAERTGITFWIESVNITLVLTGIALAPDPLWACAAVGVAFGCSSLLFIVVISRLDGIPMGRFVPGFFGPVVACAIMAGAVLATRYGLGALGLESQLAQLLIEIAVGAVVYVPAALLCAPATARDMLSLLRKAYGKRGTAGPEKAEAENRDG